jgi:hypothetical protein
MINLLVDRVLQVTLHKDVISVDEPLLVIGSTLAVRVLNILQHVSIAASFAESLLVPTVAVVAIATILTEWKTLVFAVDVTIQNPALLARLRSLVALLDGALITGLSSGLCDHF